MSKNANDTSIKKRIIILCIVAGLLLLSSITAVIIMRFSTGNSPAGKTAYVYSDGVLVRQIDLDLSEDTTFMIETADGGFNVLMIKDHDICVSDATCPNGLCIKQGYAGKTHIPVVCLPNKLVIVVKNKATGKEGEYDTITY